MPVLTRKRQLAVKIESVEGTAETLAATDAKLLAYEPNIDFGSPQTFDRTPSKSSFSKLGKVIGKRLGTLPAKFELRGSGVAATEPEWSKIIRACGLKISILNSITIGAITNGPFQHGEVITGGTSAATGRVIINTATGTTTLYFVALTGTFISGEVITGGTSAATATTGSVPSAAGKVWEPTSTQSLIPTLTLGGYEDGIRKLLAGCRGNFKLDMATVGEPAMIDCSLSGVYAGIADISLLSGIAHETSKPPVFLSSQFTIDGFAGKISQFSFDSGNTISENEDGNNQYGIISYIIGDRNPVGSFTIQDELLAAKDLWAKLYAGAEMALDIRIGSTAGNKFRLFMPKLQLINIAPTDKNGIQYLQCPFTINGYENIDDVEFAMLAL